MSPTEIVQAQLDAYNARDLDAYCGLFAEDCIVGDLNGPVTQTGKAALRERYAQLFATYPNNQARLVNRIAVGDVVVDHEEIARDPSQASVLALAIYTVRDERIVRMDFVR